MRLLLVPALALLLAGVAGAPLAQAADEVVAPISAGLERNANVRFGPTTSAKVVVTLKAGTQVEVFGPSKSSADWYVIRFPKEGKVWVHIKNLKALDGGVRYQVTTDKTRARNDATLSADVVAELNSGDVVEDKGLVVGDWRAVNIPDAVAYVHKSLVNMPANAEADMQNRLAIAANADQVWQQALSTYARFVEIAKANPQAAVDLDWAGLATQLDVVVAGHASAATKIAAKRVRESISALIKPITDLAPQLGKPAPKPIAPPPVTPVNPTPTAPVVTGGTTAAPVIPPLPPLPPMPPPSPYQAEGLLVQDDSFMAKVGTRDVLMDGNGDVIAFIKAKDGVDLKLSEIQQRYVGAKGEVLSVAPELSGLATPTKLIVATDVAPLGK